MPVWETRLYGEVRSKKNSKRIVVAHGKPRIVSSVPYKAWEKDAVAQLLRCQVSPFRALREGQNVAACITIYRRTKRKYDLTNMGEGVMDALVLAGILDDDNADVVHEVTVRRGGVDKENPGCAVRLEWTD